MAIVWNRLTEDKKQAYADKYKRGERIDYNLFSASPESVKRYIRRYCQTTSQPVPTAIPAPKDTVDDAALLGRFLHGLAARKQYAPVMHLCDIHYPYHDQRALDLTYKLIEHVQPDVIVMGSDAFDFALLSSFGIDPDHAKDADELELVEQYWNPHLNAVMRAAPNAKRVFIWGNHERRLIRYMTTNAPGVRNTIWTRFREIISSNGAVWWLGETDRVRVGNVIVQHGVKHGKYAAKGSLEILGYQVSTMFGHNHKPSYYYETGYDYPVRSVGSGCLCQLEPHYVRGTKLQSGWTQGTCIGDIDLHGHKSGFNNLEYHHDPDGTISTRLGFTSFAV